jgi:hypothetical protein
MDAKCERTNAEVEMRGLHDKDKEQGETEVDLIYDVLKVLFAAVITALIFMPLLSSTEKPVEKKLPCDVAEISPDFSQEDKERCRLIRGHKL